MKILGSSRRTKNSLASLTIEQSFCAVRASDVGDKVVGQQRKLRPVKSARSVERLGSEQADKCSSGLTCQPVVSAVAVGESGLPHNTTIMRDNDAKRRNSALAESLTSAASADGANSQENLFRPLWRRSVAVTMPTSWSAQGTVSIAALCIICICV